MAKGSVSFVEELNPVQQNAVRCTEGPVMIVAGAGSGKTRVLTYRIAYLMKKGVDPFNILALTFTNKAAREMKERIRKLVGGNEAKNLWMGTFHSVFSRILRAEHEKLGYPQNFTIYDTDDSRSLIKEILREQQLDEKIYKPNMVQSRISAAKNNLMSASSYNNNPQIQEDDKLSGKPKIGLVYRIYQARLFKAAAMDFDDLLYNTNVLLRDHNDILVKYQHRFKYIMVDEYQDTNFSQYVIVKQLAAAFRNICVVGDDAQSIYAFRGANIQNILNFGKDYPELQKFKLEQNYRSSNTIVTAANSVIKNNKEQLEKTVWTKNPPGEKIHLLKAVSDNEEGHLVARRIFDIKMNFKAWNREFAVLYRTNAQSRAIEEALRKHSIPYRIYGGLSFYQRKEIKDILAYFRLVLNNHDEESLKRVINYPTRGIGETSLHKLILAATDHDVSTFSVIENINDFSLDISAVTRNRIADFSALIKSLSNRLKEKNAFELGMEIATASGLLKEMHNDKTPEGVNRYENVQELLNGMKEFSEGDRPAIDLPEDALPGEEKEFHGLDEYMADIALLTDADEDEDDGKDRVSLMTIHASKGLEFPNVFIVGLEENLFPSQYALTSRSELEEERRLFYVAVTRAEKRLCISYAETRYKWGNLQNCEPSRFIEEIDSDCVDAGKSKPSRENHPYQEERPKVFRKFNEPETAGSFAKVKGGTKPSPKKNLVKASLAKSAPAPYDHSHLKDLKPGMSVEHERFGRGKVLKLEGDFPNSKATVLFENNGEKQLILKFARLTIVT
ncbi:MAG: UvrD-helicase domain-containing protein [Bacteroidia bacterium]|nr:UvrD-helicase domain-containing protein [Bacteroidia bacterium]